MSKLKLVNLKKTYIAGTERVEALKGINLEFRENEFVSILGQSGCGKTTLLNTIGGLDHYNRGDLIINDISTKKFKNADWDAYRNRSIGFVFQNYNLISHQTVLQNVEIAMTLSGVNPSERKRRAKDALRRVGLSNQFKKKPSQMSGGQMQRVAIARAIVNNPDIILADEPTGALDSSTSIQIMNILKEISKTKLVIMVTHNPELAEQYSTRIIRLLDGYVKIDTNPVRNNYLENNNMERSRRYKRKRKKKFKRTSMSMITALSLSFKNLLSKKGRTIITAFAGSIGIIGIALIMALSNGLTTYIRDTEEKTLSDFPIMITTSPVSVDFISQNMGMDTKGNNNFEKYTSESIIYNYDAEENTTNHSNIMSDYYVNYINEMPVKIPNAVNDITYISSLGINLLAKGSNQVVKFDTNILNMSDRLNGKNLYWKVLPNNEFIKTSYDLIGKNSRLPENKNEIVLVVDEYNRIDKQFLEKLGVTGNTTKYKIEDFIGQTILKVISNNNFYTKNEDNYYKAVNISKYEDLYNNDEGIRLTIVGVVRAKHDSSSKFLKTGIGYTKELANYLLDSANKSEISSDQKSSENNILTGTPFNSISEKNAHFKILGIDKEPEEIDIYSKGFNDKEKIKDYLDAYNKGKNNKDKVIYTDLASTVTGTIGTLLTTITYVLSGFAGISLIVSTIMIGIITYVSVIERTKEIGILRSIGARKKDISRVFNAETMVLGFISGILGIALALIIILTINSFIYKYFGIKDIAYLKFLQGLILVIGSMILTLMAGLIPSRMASNKDPVIALRSQ